MSVFLAVFAIAMFAISAYCFYRAFNTLRIIRRHTTSGTDH